MRPATTTPLHEIRDRYVCDLSRRLKTSGKPTKIYPFVGIHPERKKFCAIGNMLGAVCMAANGWLVYNRHTSALVVSPEQRPRTALVDLWEGNQPLHESY